MKHIFLLAFLLMSGLGFAQVKIGDNPTTIGASSLLELESTDKALLITRVANTAAVTSPVDGMLIYDISASCIKVHENGGWSDCLTSGGSNAPNLIFNHVVSYNSGSVENKIDDEVMGYNGEVMPANSTITISVTANEVGPYNFTAFDPVSNIAYSATGNFASTGTFNVDLIPGANVVDPLTEGKTPVTLVGASNALLLLPHIDVKSIPASATQVVDVTYPGAGTWMDRNLGAQRASTSKYDNLARGSLFQWGRNSDGHEITIYKGDAIEPGKLLNLATKTRATSDTPGHNNYIKAFAIGTGAGSQYNGDWRTDHNQNRWKTNPQGPCPSGYHVPTKTELEALAATEGGIYSSDVLTLNPGGLVASGYVYDTQQNVGTAATDNLNIPVSNETLSWYHTTDFWTSPSYPGFRFSYSLNTNGVMGSTQLGQANNVRCKKN